MRAISNSEMRRKIAVPPYLASGRNQILGLLPEQIFSALAPYLADRILERGQVLHEPGQRIESVYFPHSGLISLLGGTEQAARIETVTVGRDGAIGLAAGIGPSIAFSQAVVHVPGAAAEISADRFADVAEESGTLRTLIFRHSELVAARIQQSAVCLALHDLEQRLCRWLLEARELSGDVLPLTQEQIADLLGVRRTSVTLFMRNLHLTGAVRTRRGVIEIFDVAALEAKVCSCYRAMREISYPRLGSLAT